MENASFFQKGRAWQRTVLAEVLSVNLIGADNLGIFHLSHCSGKKLELNNKEIKGIMWFEDLPENCPPKDAVEPSDFLCFRLVSKCPPTKEDYFSLRKIYPDKTFNANECRARSLSVFNEKSECEKYTSYQLTVRKLLFL